MAQSVTWIVKWILIQSKFGANCEISSSSCQLF
jgi:hypothetical protein